ANFGQSVSISGTTAVIGAAGGSTDAAYVFVRGSGAWSQQQKLTLGGDSTSDFGAAVTVAGNTAVIGAPLHDSFTGGFKADVVGAPGYDGTSTDQGAAYVFYRLPDLGSGAGPSWTHASGYQHHDFTTTSGTQLVTNGTEVLVDDAYSQALGKRGSVYRYMGAD